MSSDRRSKASRKGSGLLATGSSDAWELAIDESLDNDHRWEGEIEGPNVYLSFAFEDLNVIRNASDYLQTRLLNGRESLVRRLSPQDGLTLGKIGPSKLGLIWDNEDDFDRCFLVLGPAGNSTIRLSLFGDDIKMLSKAFQNLVNDLPDDS